MLISLVQEKLNTIDVEGYHVKDLSEILAERHLFLEKWDSYLTPL